MKFYFKSGLTLFLTLFLAVSAFGEKANNIKTIHIATPPWEGQTNKDGTGLFFEIVRNVYEPVGIEMTYEFVPWKRAQKMINSNEADGMLCVWQKHAQEQKQLIPNYPMFVEYTAVVFKKEKIKEWKGLETIKGKKAVWLRGYDYHTMPRLKDIKLKWNETDIYEEAWAVLDRDRADVYIDALIDIDKYIRHNHVDMSPYKLEILWGENAYVAFGKTQRSKSLIEIYDKRITELFNSGELKKIYDKWGVRFSPDPWKEVK
ncbi:substrate-binding periplasmic protein [Desulfonema magnum]|uniref:Solute-binding protein family 3 domain-containing protein, MltF-like n=1 Tax=Desulfonema magnum TaxID=45655 RepID=A0A975BUQ4_9BACT|nr:transporter substrate-binding domain-containing protein [Desulfonema magnum]QTA92101.1 Solute-binding protein family 3 domain-containing protein, MltF-like [Desulfonema magnum]